jgi:hypothetical protein
MENACEQLRDKILELIAGTLSADEAAELLRHIDQCSKCSQYFEALKADDKLLGEFSDAMRPTVARLEERVIDALNRGVSRAAVRQASVWRAILTSPITRFAAAAVLLIGVGYIAGVLSASRVPDIQQLESALGASLKASLGPAIREDLLQQMNERWESVFATSCVQIKDELHQQVQRDLTEFAAQTLAASRTLTDQRVMELVRLIEAARMQDRRRVAEALEQIELNRLQDRARFGNGLQVLAAQTSERLGAEQN